MLEIEFMSKDNALSLLMDHLGMKGKHKLEIGASGNLENVLGVLLQQVEGRDNVVTVDSKPVSDDPLVEGPSNAQSSEV